MSKIESRLIRQNVVLFAALLIMAIIAFVLNISIGDTNESISEAEKDRELALQVVDELRQSSDDLTRMARMYVVTEDSSYIQYFNEIIKIRDGKASRPIDYHEIYWDFVLASGTSPRPRAEQIALVDLLQMYISSNEAAEYFTKAKNSSDDLILIEEEAFNAMKGVYKDSLGEYSVSAPPNKQAAIDLLHGKAYLAAKAKIMESIQDFSHFVNGYTNDAISALLEHLKRLRWMLIAIVGIAIITLTVVVFTNVRFLLHSRREKKDESISGKLTFGKFLKEAEHSWVVVLISFVFSTLVIAFLFYANSSIKKNIEQSISQSLLTVNQTTNKNIQDWLSDLEKSASILVASESIHDDFISLLKGEVAPYENGLDKHITSNVFQSSFVGYVVVNQEMIVVQSSSPHLNGRSLNELERDEALARMRDNQFSALSFPCKMGRSDSYNKAIKVSSPIIDENDAIIGRLILLFNPKERFTEVLQQGRLGNSGESYAFNNQGMMISDSRFNDQLIEQGFIKEGQSSELNIELKDPTNPEKGYTLMAKDALKGYAGVNVSGYNDYRGIKVVGTWNWFEKYGFGIATEIDYDEAFKTYLLVNRLGLYSGILFILLIASLTVVFVFNRLKLSGLNAEMTRQKSLLENTIESLPHPFYVVNTKDYSLMLANQAAKDMSANGIITTCHALTHKRDKPCDSINDPCPLKMVRETKEPVVVEHTHFDKNGEKIFAEVHGYPIFNEAGEVVHMIEYSLNITDRKLAEEKIQAANQRFQAIVDNLADALIIIDDKGSIQFFSPSAEKLFQHTAEEVQGKNVKLLMTTPHQENHDQYLANYHKTGVAKAIGQEREVEAFRKDGSIFPARLMISEIRTGNNRLYVGLIGDLTERKKYQAVIEEANKRMSGELNVAKDIQMSMLPLIFPAFPKRQEIDVYAELIPAREVGGDFYDFFFVDEDHFCMVVGDVSGKGVPAALMMAVCKTLIKSNSRNVYHTSKVLTWVNNEMAKENENAMFVTVFMGILNTKTGEFTYTNAGHNPTFIKRADGSVDKLTDLHGVVIAAMEGLKYKESKIIVNPGDIIFAYTDGIPEAHSPEGKMFGDDRLSNLLLTPFKTPKQLIKAVVKDVKSFEGGLEAFDDLTALSVQYRGLKNKTNSES